MLGLGLMVRSLDFILSLRGSAGSPCRDLRGKVLWSVFKSWFLLTSIRLSQVQKKTCMISYRQN